MKASGNPEKTLVPVVWWFELRNVLVINERRKRLTPEESNDFLRVLASFPIQVDDDRDEKAMLAYNRNYKLSFCDAAYLDVAFRNGLPVVTLDKALRAAAQSAGVVLLA